MHEYNQFYNYSDMIENSITIITLTNVFLLILVFFTCGPNTINFHKICEVLSLIYIYWTLGKYLLKI
jgi:hypothetical protein